MKLLCLGDSLTEGYEIDGTMCWTHLLQEEIQFEVVNAGISGDTTSGMLSRCERLLIEHKPTHIIIFGGTNDLWFGLKDEYILANIHAMSRQARYHNVISFIGIPTPSININEVNMVHENYSECIRSFKNALIAYCKNDDKAFIDFSIGIEDQHFLEDGLHPNEKGQQLMMTNVKRVLMSYISQNGY